MSLRDLWIHTNQDRGPGVKPGQVQRGRAYDDDRKPAEAGPSRRRAIGKLVGAMAALYEGPNIARRLSAASIDFFTDFREADPLRFWQSFKSSGLSVESDGIRRAARPRGVNLLVPSERLEDGEVTFRLAPGPSPASFVLRAKDDNNGYWVNLIRQPGSTAIYVWRRRKGVWVRVTGHAEADGRNMAHVEPWLRFKLDGKYFTASLLQNEPNALDGFAPGVFRPKARVLHNWIDKNIRTGAVGLAGPAKAGDGAFRVYSVAVSNQPSKEETA